MITDKPSNSSRAARTYVQAQEVSFMSIQSTEKLLLLPEPVQHLSPEKLPEQASRAEGAKSCSPCLHARIVYFHTRHGRSRAFRGSMSGTERSSPSSPDQGREDQQADAEMPYAALLEQLEDGDASEDVADQLKAFITSYMGRRNEIDLVCTPQGSCTPCEAT